MNLYLYSYIFFNIHCIYFIYIHVKRMFINLQVYFSFRYDQWWHNIPWRAKTGERFRRGFYGKMTVVWEVSCLYALEWWGMSMQLGQSHLVILSSAIPSLFSLTDEYSNYLTIPVPTQFCCNVAASTGSYLPCEL